MQSTASAKVRRVLSIISGRSELDANVANLLVVRHRFHALLAADAGVLEAAERRLIAADEPLINEDRAGFEAIDPARSSHLLGLFERSHMEYEADRARDAGEGDHDERGEGDGNPDGAELLGSGALNDYEVVGSSNLSVPLDMGDLPDSYGTTAANGGARHLPNGLTLGSSIDQETNGQPNASATGDGADENGVSASSPSANWGGGTGAFLVTVNGGPGCLNAWMDFTNDSGSGVGASFADGNFTKTGGYDAYSSFSEHLVQNQLLTNGVTDVTFSVPTSLLGGGSTNYYFRFRLSPTDGNGQCTVPVGPTGLISGGEVEDYQVTFPPLAATLNSFSAEAQGDRIMVIWETVSELDNISFNLYRSDSATGALNLLAFMPSQGPGSSQGFAYSYDDLDVQIGQTYWYWLEDISVSGVTTLHGPVSATLLQPTAVTVSYTHLTLPTIYSV